MIFDCLSAHLQKHQTHYNWVLIVLGWKIIESLDLLPSPMNHEKYYLEILPMTISISWPSFIWKWFTE